MGFKGDSIFRVGLISLLLVAIFIQFYYGQKSRKSGWDTYSFDRAALKQEGALTFAGGQIKAPIRVSRAKMNHHER